MFRLLSVIAVVVSLPMALAAHSKLASSTPANEAVIATAPTEIMLSFAKKIRLTRVALVGASGTEDLDLSHVSAFETEYTLTATAIDAGDYTVEWRGLGGDGHPLSGTFSYTVE